MEKMIDDIVKRVLAEMETPASASKPVTTFTQEKPSFKGNESGRRAVLTAQETFEIKAFQIPTLSAKEVLVQMEGCMISKSDVSEFVKERRSGGVTPVGAEGTGVIIKVGSEDLKDVVGKVLKVGDKVSGIRKSGTVNLRTGSEAQACGWFSNYVTVQAGNTLYQVNNLDLESRILLETAAAINSLVSRSIKVNKLTEKSIVAVVGSGMTGLIAMAVLRANGIQNIVAIDDESMKDACITFGAKDFIGIHSKDGVQGAAEMLRSRFDSLADIAFNCVPSYSAKSTAKRLVRGGGNVADLSFAFGESRISSSFFEDRAPVGKNYMTQKEYEGAIAFLTAAAAKNIPMYQLITHRYNLNQIEEACWTVVRGEGIGVAVFNR